MKLIRQFISKTTGQFVNVVASGDKSKFTYSEYEVATAKEVFKGVTDMKEKTKIFIDWLQNQNDDIKSFFRLNWHGIPHTLFNVACNFFESKDIQNIDWFYIINSDMPTWSHQK